MHTETVDERETQADAKLRLFALYVDFAASIRARWATSAIIKLAAPRWKSTSEMWTLDSFRASQPLRKIMLQDAAKADVLVIALSSLDQREPGLIEWLNALANQKAEQSGSSLIIGLLGDQDHGAGELGWTVKQFLRCAQRMGRDFIWQWMGQESFNDTTWLTDSVEKFLLRKHSLLNMAWPHEPAARLGPLPEAVWFAANHPPATGPAAL
jgi:hypothetical protein